MHPEEDFLGEMSDWLHEIEVLSVENGATYGICYPESRRTITYLAKHEAETDVHNTMQHEPIHAVLADFQYMSDDPLDMDLEQEHKIIQKISWVANEKVFDKGYFSLINFVQVKPKLSEKEYNILMKKYNKLADKITLCN